MPRLGEELLFPRLTPSQVLAISCRKAARSILRGAVLTFYLPGLTSSPGAAVSSLKSLRCTFCSYTGKRGKKIKKIQSPSQALFRDYRQFGDRSSNSGRENFLAAAPTGVSLEKPGPRDFLRSVMSHPDPAGSSSCPWKTRLEAGLLAPTISRRGLAGSCVGTRSHSHPRTIPGC